MSKHILTSYADTRKYTAVHDGRIMETRQDAEPILEFVKHRAQMGDDSEFRYLGEMPLATFGQAIREGWIDDDKAVRKWFRDTPKFTSEWWGGAKL
jgi:hypothetical protein